jgi:hypothetical protein
MSIARAIAAMTAVLEAFDRLGAKNYVSGSIASSAYGTPRSTLDVDLVADLTKSHVVGLVAALEQEYYISRSAVTEAIQRRSCFNVIHLTTMYKVDVFAAKARAYDREALRRARRHRLADATDAPEVWLAAPEDVILSKLEWYRLGDEISERQWLDVLGVLKVQQGALDRDYLRHWSRELGVADLLERAEQQAKLD